MRNRFGTSWCDRMSTMKDVAEKAGVSTSTVSHVVNNSRYVSPELRERVEKVMDELNYSPHATARSLRTQKTYTIGFVASDITNPFFAEVVRGIEEIASGKDYQVIVANTDETAEKEVRQIECLLDQERVDGLIIAPTGKNPEEFKRIDDKPLVFVDRTVPGIRADTVLSENVKGAYKAVNYLINRGHERIGIILGLKDILTSEERFEGYKKALIDANLPCEESYITRGNFKVDGAIGATEKLLSLAYPPTAIFTINNKTTYGALKAIKRSRLNWREDIEIAGFDKLDCLEFIDLPITTIEQQPRKLGIKAARLLYERIENREAPVKTVKIDVELVTRD